MHSLKLNEEACTRCRKCVDTCFVNALKWDTSIPKGAPVLAYPADCQICCYCEKLCPTQALEIIPDWASKYIPRTLSNAKGW
ncbi:ATP-binding protein [Holophaga foetida]|uniref:ATP-binding protein n=1 Tax=Holophaga foetida TaxID=35839 RepID=UPI000247468F|nr:ferredoxin family protein [Holophaga foetida]